MATYKDYPLHNNQIEAIQLSLANDFATGIHFHATGTGKSWIAMMLLLEFNNRYPNKNILWICEKKDILQQQFNKQTLYHRNFKHILERFNILNFSIYKPKDWVHSVHASKFWNKPCLCIINRAFLVSQEKYKKIQNTTFHLVIHDECHSVENKTTQAFYKWLLATNNPKARIIGFSATPELIFPFQKILSSYSIYDAFKDNVILPARILWFKSKNKPSSQTLLNLIIKYIKNLPYQKLIIWCGTIKQCEDIYLEWSQADFFKDFMFSMDYYKLSSKTNTFEDFYHLESKGLLFCAMKHREGSDIPHLDGCIFMDDVEKRSQRVFIQSLGRVLRKDTEQKKTYGLIIDTQAHSTIHICNRVQKYLRIYDGFPWHYTIHPRYFRVIPKTENEKRINVYYANCLTMVPIKKENHSDGLDGLENRILSTEEITSRFIRPLPEDDDKYRERLAYELSVYEKKNIFNHLMLAMEILEITKDIPHITRGSCGSSLVCYLLGISHIDPVKYHISFSRFMNRYRDSLPDIDFDFPHYLRDEVFLKCYIRWGNKVARISNHNYYQEKSALREALRQCGIRKFIPKYQLMHEINSLDSDLKNKVMKTKKELEGQFKNYSLHCGGIIYYPGGIPKDELLIQSHSGLFPQVSLNKIDVSKNKNFKIDILSSGALSVVFMCHDSKKCDFNLLTIYEDKKTSDMLSRGDNIGLILGESPLMRQALLSVKPKSMADLALCLSIIRPAAREAKNYFEKGCYDKEKHKNCMIYDDDAIQIISRLLPCDEEEADYIRRGYIKQKKEIIDRVEKNKVLSQCLKNLRKYSFCKAHAYSYGQLVWVLAYYKANHPIKFWLNRLKFKNLRSEYPRSVYLFEYFRSIDSRKNRKELFNLLSSSDKNILIDVVKVYRFMNQSLKDTIHSSMDKSLYGLILYKKRKKILLYSIDKKSYILVFFKNKQYTTIKSVLSMDKKTCNIRHDFFINGLRNYNGIPYVYYK